MIHSLDIPRDDAAPRVARQALDEVELDHALREDALLLLSELVTNTLRHGEGESVRVILDTGDGTSLRCEVIDQGHGFVPEALRSDRDTPGGWGLTLVERVSSSWGVREGSTHVWFELGST